MQRTILNKRFENFIRYSVENGTNSMYVTWILSFDGVQQIKVTPVVIPLWEYAIGATDNI